MPSESYILPPRRNRLLTIGRVVFAILWTLVACEMYLRFFDPQPLMPRNVVASDFGIRMNKPNIEYWQKSPEIHVRVKINSQGIRADYEIPLEKPPGVKRIVVLGDSYGMGYEVDLKDAFTSVMADQLQAAGYRVEIVNLSVSGFGNAEELLMLEHRGFAFHPDLVLLAWHPTDFDDNLRCQLYALKDGKLVRDKPDYLPGVRTRQMLESIPGYSWVEANSQLYSFIREETAGRVKDFLAQEQGGGSMPPANGPAPAQANATTQPARPAGPPTYGERLTVALLNEIRLECGQKNIPFLILEVPNTVNRMTFLSEFPYEASREVGGFDVVSPMDIFTQHLGQKLFWERGHHHFTILACRLVGDELAQHILEQKLLGPLPRGQ